MTSVSSPISARPWGLSRAVEPGTAAARAELWWRWPVLLAMLATIPAFYIELLEQLPTRLASAIYVTAACLIAVSLWRVARRLADPRPYLRSNALDLVLMLGLLLAAALPPSTDSNQALAVRLLVSILTLVRMVWAFKSSITRGGLPYLLLTAFLVLGGCGVGFWALDPNVHSLGDGLWLAFTTAATVGYGDIVPIAPASKIFSVFVVLLGYAVLSLVTAAIAAVWVETSEQRMEREILDDLHDEVRGLREELAAMRDEMRRKEQGS
jgi:voltage-gated potassium channel